MQGVDFAHEEGANCWRSVVQSMMSMQIAFETQPLGMSHDELSLSEAARCGER